MALLKDLLGIFRDFFFVLGFLSKTKFTYLFRPATFEGSYICRGFRYWPGGYAASCGGAFGCLDTLAEDV